MSVEPGDPIGRYLLEKAFTPGNSSRYGTATSAGERFFVKEFLKPKYPPDFVTGPVREQKLARCRAFEDRHRSLVSALGTVCARGGTIVMPVDFLRLALMYYHIAPCIDTTSLTPADIAAATPRERLFLLRMITRSLMTLHSVKVVHGDLKPPNILITKSAAGWSPKIIDFDGAFFAGNPPDKDDLTYDQNYVAPEIVAFQRAAPEAVADCRRKLGTAADIFSLGVLIHEYWTGRRPGLPAGVDYVMTAMLDGKPLAIHAPGLPSEVDGLMRQALSPDPARRPTATVIDTAIALALKTMSSSAYFLSPTPGKSGMSEPQAPPPKAPEPRSAHSAAGVIVRLPRKPPPR